MNLKIKLPDNMKTTDMILVEIKEVLVKNRQGKMVAADEVYDVVIKDGRSVRTYSMEEALIVKTQLEKEISK